MYTNILIPTDGSELAGKAVQHGIALAKRIGAKATVLTVLTPFHTFTIDTQMIEDTSVALANSLTPAEAPQMPQAPKAGVAWDVNTSKMATV